MGNRPKTKDELSRYALTFCRRRKKIILNYRLRLHTDKEYKSAKVGRWDPPRIVVACCSLIFPFRCEKGYNSTTLKNGHLTLRNAYSNVGMTIGVKLTGSQKKQLGKPFWVPGHCAEPHAVHALLNTMDKKGVPIRIKDIRFGIAFNLADYSPKEYCNTCKKVFPQLK